MRKLGMGNVVLAAACAALIAACGGGNTVGSGGSSSGGTSSGGTSSGGSTPTAAAVSLLSSSSTLNSDADTPTEGVQLSATVTDSNNNVLSGVAVQFAVNNQGVIAVTQGTTDASGLALATLTTTSNRFNRDLTVRATAGTVSSELVISVVGTKLSDPSGPDSLAVGNTATYTVSLLDNDNRGIGGATVSVSSARGNSLSATTLTTGTDGSVSVDVTITSALDDVLTFTVAGLSKTKPIDVSNDQFRILRPNPSDPSGVRVFRDPEEFALNADIPVVVEWLQGGSAATTAGKTVSLSGTRGIIHDTTGATVITSVVLDANGRGSFTINSADAGALLLEASGSSSTSNPAVSVSAEFVASDADLVNVQFDPKVIGPNSQSTVTVTVSDNAGNLVKNVRVNFRLTDPTNGALSASSATTNSQGRASITYKANSTQSANGGVVVRATVAQSTGAGVGNFDEDALTVNGRALRIVLGTGNTILIKNESQYQMPYSVIVTDSAGNAVTDVDLRLEANSTRYRKGEWFVTPGATPPWAQNVTAVCLSEDVDNDGVYNITPGHDVDENTNGTLEPGNVASVPASVTLDDEGSAEFLITYPKDHARWVEIKLKASALVSGTENIASATFFLPVLADDIGEEEVTPPGEFSPYGVEDTCSNPN